jgi:mono/diheme cytochrome c family protein
MKNNLFKLFMAASACVSLALSGCGGSVSQESAPAASGTLQGVAATGAPINGTVTLTDSSAAPKKKTTATGADGSFAFSTGDLTPPFVLVAEWTDSAGRNQLHAMAEGPGTKNINPFTDAAFVAAAGASNSWAVPADVDSATVSAVARGQRSFMKQLMQKLMPLFALYGATSDPDDDEYHADHTGVDALLDDIKIAVKDGMVIVKNKKTGGIIFQALVTDINSGTFSPENMPGQPGQVDGAALYADNCSSCHKALASSAVQGATAAAIQSAIKNNTGGMGKLSSLTALQIQAIASILAGGTTTPPPATTDGAALYASNCRSCHGAMASSTVNTRTASAITTAIRNNTGGMGSLSGLTSAQITAIATALAGGGVTPPTPAACAYTYSAWATCQSNGTQLRTVQTTTPSGCSGTPVLTQSCAYVPPTPTACAYTYSVWSACQSTNTQSRNLQTTTPAGCSGTPVLTQACIYTPPQPTACTYTYSVWSACQSTNTQSRNLLTTTPAGCSGTPVLTQSCTYVPPVTIDGAALYMQYCNGCHGNGKKGKSASAIQTAINNNTGGMGSTALRALTSAQIAAISAAP